MRALERLTFIRPPDRREPWDSLAEILTRADRDDWRAVAEVNGLALVLEDALDELRDRAQRRHVLSQLPARKEQP